MSPGAYDVFWKAMSPEIIVHPGNLVTRYDNNEEKNCMYGDVL